MRRGNWVEHTANHMMLEQSTSGIQQNTALENHWRPQWKKESSAKWLTIKAEQHLKIKITIEISNIIVIKVNGAQTNKVNKAFILFQKHLQS